MKESFTTGYYELRFLMLGPFLIHQDIMEFYMEFERIFITDI